MARRMRLLAAIGLALGAAAIVQAPAAQAFDVQGHRGARGHLPENTLPGFALALRQGATTLETDLALTRDGTLILTHDPVPSPDLVRGADGTWLAAGTRPIRQLSTAEVAGFDVGRLRPGSRYAETWRSQAPLDGARMPHLTDLFGMADTIRAGVHFNIETKLSPAKPAETADPETFAAAVVAAVRAAGMTARVTVQSFDWRTLLAVKRLAPEVATSCLTIVAPNADTLAPVDGRPSPWLAGLDPAAYEGDVPRLAAAAGCSVWSPFWRNVDAAAVAQSRRLGLKVVPWTVNEPTDMDRLIDVGVDGLITDYPERAVAVATRRGLALAPLALAR
jgi:glycerophosphoryl diester phosphodiesterase